MEEEGEEDDEDSLHTVYLQLYLELIAYPCLLLSIFVPMPNILDPLNFSGGIPYFLCPITCGYYLGELTQRLYYH